MFLDFLLLHSSQCLYPMVGFPDGSVVMNLPAVQETRVLSLGQEDPPEEGTATHSSILAWRIHGQRSVVGYSPWGHKELDTTGVSEHIHMHIPGFLKY